MTIKEYDWDDQNKHIFLMIVQTMAIREDIRLGIALAEHIIFDAARLVKRCIPSDLPKAAKEFAAPYYPVKIGEKRPEQPAWIEFSGGGDIA